MARRLRAIGKDVALMTVAARAAGLHPHHAVADIAHQFDVGFVERREKARPTGARFKLGLGVKQRQPAQAAGIDAGFLVAEQSAAEGRLGAVAQQDLGFLTGQGGFQFGALGLRGRRQIEAGVRAGLLGGTHGQTSTARRTDNSVKLARQARRKSAQ